MFAIRNLAPMLYTSILRSSSIQTCPCGSLRGDNMAYGHHIDDMYVNIMHSYIANNYVRANVLT